MLNEIEEFKAYTKFPKYCATGKRDMSFLGRFTFDMLIKQIGLHRVLTIIAGIFAVIVILSRLLSGNNYLTDISFGALYSLKFCMSYNGVRRRS